MKKILFTILLSFCFFGITKAQLTVEQAGQLDGEALGNFVMNTYVYPNAPDIALFSPILFNPNPNPLLMPNGDYRTLTQFKLGNQGSIGGIRYDQYCASYAYDHGIFDFYYDYALDMFNQSITNQTPQVQQTQTIYWNSFLIAFQETIQGIEPIINP